MVRGRGASKTLPYEAIAPRSPRCAPFRAVLFDECDHRFKGLHRVWLERMLVEEGVAGAVEQEEIDAAPGLAIVGGEAFSEFRRGPLILGALEHQRGRQ